MWSNFYGEDFDIESSWPEVNESMLEIEEFELIIQVNGKVRGKLKVNKGTEQEEIKEMALTVENVNNFIGSSKLKKTIYVREKLINFVI